MSLTSGLHTHDCTTMTADSRTIPTGKNKRFLVSNDMSNTKIPFCNLTVKYMFSHFHLRNNYFRNKMLFYQSVLQTLTCFSSSARCHVV